jgi:aminoglycoside phosphotransferase (APT) family kinase protein
MHPDQVETGPEVVAALLASQFPEWASLPMTRVPSHGTDNAMYRLGDALVARVPMLPSAARCLAKECEWLPRLAPSLPLAAPVPVAVGVPEGGYPFPWSVCPWVPGATDVPLADPVSAALDLADFILALRALDASGGPAPGSHNFGRGVPLASRDEEVRRRADELHSDIDVAAALAAWETSLAAPAYDGPPQWLHGDLHASNLVISEGRLSAVIDWGGLGAGDPACDVMAAWTFVPAAGRAAFREALGCDDAAWERGRGWVVSMAIMALPYYRDTNPGIVANARRWLSAALEA